ncbi:MAG: TIGR00270 family protein [Methanobacteriota archaeon]|nr:MAG: TIGR00270 family protein [Euryarchaeota archaeon]HIG20844.1 TIGR00270 family protein [Candidatus Poseidoniales archaeon]
MGSCELCGAVSVSTKRMSMHGTFVEGCKSCQEKMGYNPDTDQAAENVARVNKKTSAATSGGYGGLGTAGKDIMVRDGKELADDFPSIIRDAREKRGWDQRTLALKMKEKINIVQRTEGGKRPGDSVIRKFEKILKISLLIDLSDLDVERTVGNKESRSLNLGDLIKMARKEGE